ncbi:transposase [bacterium]|jgi:transposase|nr:transposase [bacterium]
MEQLANLTKSLVSLVDSIPDIDCGHFEDKAQVLLSVSFGFLAATEERLRETMRVIEQLEISAKLPRQAISSWELTEIDQTALRGYQKALEQLYSSERVSCRFHLFLRLIDRFLVAPVIGPDPAVSIETSLRKLSQSKSTSRHRKVALTNILTSRIQDALKDIPKGRKELSASFRSVQGQCLRGLKGRTSAKSTERKKAPPQSGPKERKNIRLPERGHFNATEKVKILHQHLVNRTEVSDLCEKYQITPALFYQWQRTFFENGSKAFDDQRQSFEPKKSKQTTSTKLIPRRS